MDNLSKRPQFLPILLFKNILSNYCFWEKKNFILAEGVGSTPLPSPPPPLSGRKCFTFLDFFCLCICLVLQRTAGEVKTKLRGKQESNSHNVCYCYWFVLLQFSFFLLRTGKDTSENFAWCEIRWSFSKGRLKNFNSRSSSVKSGRIRALVQVVQSMPIPHFDYAHTIDAEMVLNLFWISVCILYLVLLLNYS